MHTVRHKGIIFDLDGTLVNSIEDLADSMNYVLAQNNFGTYNTNTYKQFVGTGIRNLVIKALPNGHKDEQTVNKCFKMMLETYSQNCTNKTKPYEGITQMLNELTNRKIKMAILSNKADKLAQRVAKEILSKWHFETVIGFTDEESRKPNPKSTLQIVNELNLPKPEILYLGDSGTDMQTANNAGLYAIGALWGFRSEEELVLNGAKHLLKHPMELLDIM